MKEASGTGTGGHASPELCVPVVDDGECSNVSHGGFTAAELHFSLLGRESKVRALSGLVSRSSAPCFPAPLLLALGGRDAAP